MVGAPSPLAAFHIAPEAVRAAAAFPHPRMNSLRVVLFMHSFRKALAFPVIYVYFSGGQFEKLSTETPIKAPARSWSGQFRRGPPNPVGEPHSPQDGSMASDALGTVP